LKKRGPILGAEHPDTIAAANNLAITVDRLGRLEEAVSMRKEVLEKRKRIHGVEHLDTVLATSNLAAILCRLGSF
jgi:hypothetical protein